MKNAVITGASTGIGYAIAAALIKRGYRVFGSVRKEVDAQRLRKALGKQFEPLLFDVTDEASIKQEADRVAQQIGSEGIQALINNAGIAVAGPLLHLPLEELKWQLEVNVVGLLATTQAFAPLLGARSNCPHEPGKIYNVSSVAGKIAQPFMGPYCASKHAVEALSESLRIELMPFGIDVVVLGPGVVRTPIWDKAQSIDLSAYEKTSYAKPLKAIQDYMAVHSKTGFDQDEFAAIVANIIETPKPKWRYALVKEKFTNWTVPRLLSKRQFARIIGKRLGLMPEE